MVEPLLVEVITPGSGGTRGCTILCGLMPPPLSTQAVSELQAPPELNGAAYGDYVGRPGIVPVFQVELSPEATKSLPLGSHFIGI